MCGIGSDWIKAGQEADLEAGFPGEQQDRALIIFAKNPVLGKVKTRLAKTMGDQAAFDAYLMMLSAVRAVAAQVDCHRAVFYSDFIDESDDWQRPAFSKHVQSSGDIGAKMRAAIVEMLAQGYQRVVLVGSDFLDLQVQHLEQAFRALSFADLVLGPAEDGGYYLIGMKAMEPALFTDIPWSTDAVAATTLDRAAKLGMEVHLAPPISDIDEEPEWIAALERHHKRHPNT